MTSALASARDLLERGVKAGTFSGAQAAWIRGGAPVELACAGATRAQQGRRVGPQTLFDIASLTKLFTASCALRMVARDELDLAEPLRELVPGLDRASTGRATLEQLLAHEAGFRDWAPLFESVVPEMRGASDGATAIFDLACRVPPQAEPGVTAVYSDLGFIVLGRVIELAAEGDLDEVVTREVTEPLGLSSIRYRSTLRSSRSERSRVAATADCPWRGRVLQGEVHDDNAWAMGCVAGHAGLFADAADVARFGAAWLDALEGGGWLKAELARRAVARRPLGRGLGWDLKSEEGSAAGERMGPRTFGHLGFSGCSLWVDPDAQLSVALLTNRIHPTWRNEAIREFRPAFHDALLECLG